VNILSVELDHSLDEAGFRHDEASVGEMVGGQWIGASVYAAVEGVPIWPYHYHHGAEEWLYVISGAPVLREPAGERALAAGDLVSFPSGHLGAHTVKGPGRFVIFATGYQTGTYLSVYPDSDKVSGPGNILLRSSAVGYWHGEGTTGAAEPVEITREPAGSPPRPVVNALEAEPGPVLSAERLAAAIVDAVPYHYVHGREEWLLVLAGTPALRHPQGELRLEPGDLLAFPEGPDGARGLRGDPAVRALLLSTTDLPANVFYPDSGEWRIHNGPDDVVVLRPTL